MTMNVGESEISSGIAVGELFMIEAEKMQDGGVQIMDVNFLLHGGETELIGGSISHAALHAAPGWH